MRLTRLASYVTLVVPLGCSSSTAQTGDGGGTDAATDMVAAPDAPPGDSSAPDGSQACEGEFNVSLHVNPPEIYLVPGTHATVTVQLDHDRCAPLVLPVTSDAPATATADATASIAGHASTAPLAVNAVAVGRTTLHVGGATGATLVVNVRAPGVPDCSAATAGGGHLAPGLVVRATAGSPLDGASVAIPAAATSIAPLDVTLGCAPAQVPTGYVAVGPAVQFGPVATRFPREVPITLPINPALVPAGYEMQVEVSYSSPTVRAARVVPVADLHFLDDPNGARALTFAAPRLGTWQAVIRQGLGARHFTRHFTYHAILGVSMGAAGAGMIGMRHMDKFDFIVPLGGPVDWNYLGNYIKTWHVGGFCTAAQRALDPTGCAAGARTDRTPTSAELFEHPQDFEHWFYPDGYGGQGGTFDRQSYSQIFRDLTRMFGNAIIQPGPTGVLPIGVPDGELTRSDADRCAHPVVIDHGFYDDEYNPDGTLPVITFCDGTHTPGHAGVWDGTVGNFPLEVGLAVDVNRNGRRDPGEPVIRDFTEPYRDVGTDGRPSAMEPGYDAVTNPDPAGDDYDRQFNPGGTEGNFAHEDGEPFDDVGLDGVACPAGVTCMYDSGEGNHRFDMTPGSQRFQDVNPRSLAAAAPADALHRLDVWSDGGVRDLFNFGCDADHFVGALAQRGRPVHYYNNFAPLGGGRVSEDNFPYTDIDWARAPGDVMLRYGSLDASNAALINGDGGHVGTVVQITNRLFSSLWWVQARWPGGDRATAMFSSDSDDAGHCANGYFCSFDYHSDHANRTGPVSIYLPPGYHEPENAALRYPVVFFLHGYGQQPQDLAASGLIIGNFMAGSTLPDWRRPQKYIMVFPDGRCRAQDGCLRGTFYTDSPVHNAQMETYFLDLYDFVDHTFRTRAPEDVDVVE